MFPRSTHETFSTKLFQSFKGHARLEKAKFSETDFTMSHYAGKVPPQIQLYNQKRNVKTIVIFRHTLIMIYIVLQVTYQTDSFLDKNRDYIIVEHCNLLSSSKCSFISGLFASLPEESSRSSYKFSSVASRFKVSTSCNMVLLSILCIHLPVCMPFVLCIIVGISLAFSNFFISWFCFHFSFFFLFRIFLFLLIDLYCLTCIFLYLS